MIGAQQLRRRLEDAVVDDARHQAVDAAKKKAVAARCNVDTFNALVSAVHLRPMRGGTGLRILGGPGGLKPAAARCFAADGSIAAPAAVTAAMVAATAATASTGKAAADDALRSGTHWARAWRAAPAAADRRRLLARAVEAGALTRLLRLELSSRLLEDILDCLAAAEEGAAGKPQQLGGQDAPSQQPGEEPQEGRQAASAPAAAAVPTLAAAVLQAAAGASSFAVAKAGLCLHGRQRLACLAAAHTIAIN